MWERCFTINFIVSAKTRKEKTVSIRSSRQMLGLGIHERKEQAPRRGVEFDPVTQQFGEYENQQNSERDRMHEMLAS